MEVHAAVRANGGEVTIQALAEMPLVKSAVYEALRIEPPVAMQYGRAKRDMVVESHDYGYEVPSPPPRRRLQFRRCLLPAAAREARFETI